jgi:hypothetical protein
MLDARQSQFFTSIQTFSFLFERAVSEEKVFYNETKCFQACVFGERTQQIQIVKKIVQGIDKPHALRFEHVTACNGGGIGGGGGGGRGNRCASDSL